MDEVVDGHYARHDGKGGGGEGEGRIRVQVLDDIAIQLGGVGELLLVHSEAGGLASLGREPGFGVVGDPRRADVQHVIISL